MKTAYNGRMRTLILFSLVLVLSGCGGVGVEPTALPPLTLNPPPTPILRGDCNVTDELENWLRLAAYSRRDFLELVQEAGSRNRHTLFADTIEMDALLQSLAGRPAPDCAQELQEALLGIMGETTLLFQEYVNGDRDDLSVIVENATRELQLTAQTLSELEHRLQLQRGE